MLRLIYLLLFICSETLLVWQLLKIRRQRRLRLKREVKQWKESSVTRYGGFILFCCRQIEACISVRLQAPTAIFDHSHHHPEARRKWRHLSMKIYLTLILCKKMFWSIVQYWLYYIFVIRLMWFLFYYILCWVWMRKTVCFPAIHDKCRLLSHLLVYFGSLNSKQ